MNKPTRYVVKTTHQAYPNAEIEEAVVSYNTNLDNTGLSGGVTSLSMAIHTASRYHGQIFAEYAAYDGSQQTLIKDFRRKSERGI